MPITPIAGQRTTQGVNQILQARRVEDFADEIWNPEAGFKNQESALAALLNNLKQKREVKNPKFQILEDVYRPRESTISGAHLGNATTVNVTTPFGSYCRAGTLLYVPSTGELIRVGAVASATQFTGCTRNFGNLGAYGKPTGTVGGTTAEGDGVALSGGETVLRVVDNFAEGTSAPDAITIQTEASYNLTEIVKTTVDLSDTLMQSELYGEPDEPYQIKKKGIEHTIDINRSLWLGRRSIITTGAGAERKTAGALQYLQGNNMTISDHIVTLKVFDEFAEMVFENGSDVRYLFGSMRFASALDALPRPFIKVDDKATSFGTDMREIKTNKGTFLFVLEKKVFYGDLIGKVPCLDLAQVKYAYMRGRDTKFYRSIKDINHDGYDGRKHLWQTEFGLDMSGFGLDHSQAAAGTTSPLRSVHGLMDFGTGITY